MADVRHERRQTPSTDFPSVYPSTRSTTREHGTIIRSQMSICCGVGMALLSTRRLPSDASIPTESMYASLTSERSSGAASRKRSLGVASIVPDRFVKRGEEPLVRRCQHNQIPARRELSRRQRQLCVVVRDVFEHVHIKNRIIKIILIEVRQRANPNAAAVG